MHVVCVVASLGSGGGERVLNIVANWWARQGHSVDVVVLSEPMEPFFPFNEAVNVHFLSLTGVSAGPLAAIINNFNRVMEVRRILNKLSADVVVSFMDTTNVVTLLACLGTPHQVVVTEHTVPTFHSIGKVWNALRNLMYPLAQSVIVQSEEAKRYFPEAVQDKSTILPNPVELSSEVAEISIPGDKIIIAMGRLSHEKGFDLLLRAFGSIAAAFPEWSLFVLGEGKLREELETLQERLGLAGRVHFPGFVSCPAVWLESAELFVLSSRFEGFGNVLVEAMMSGLPVISTDCPWGPATVIRDGVDGLLVASEDSAALAGAMERLMGDGELRASLSEQAKLNSKRYRVESVMPLWNDVIFSAGGRQ